MYYLLLLGLPTPLSSKSATRPSCCPHGVDLVHHGFDLVVDGVANPLKQQINIMGHQIKFVVLQIGDAAELLRGGVGYPIELQLIQLLGWLLRFYF